MLYGDSLVFGWGVAEGERFYDIVERETPALEVWNHVVPGYGLDQEIILYEKERHLLPVDEVLFFVAGSTLRRIRTNYIFAKYKPMFVQEPEGQLTLIRVPRLKNLVISALYDVLSPFYFPYLVQTAVANLQAGLGHGDTPGREARSGIEQRRDLGILETALLNRAVQMTRESRHRITILAANLSQADRRWLRAFCGENDVNLLEISLEFGTAAVDGGLVFGKYDRHSNARANALIAQDLLTQMRARASSARAAGR